MCWWCQARSPQPRAAAQPPPSWPAIWACCSGSALAAGDHRVDDATFEQARHDLDVLGCCVIPGVLTQPELEGLRAALDRAATAPDPTILERLRPFIGIVDSSDPTIVPVRSELGDYLSDKHRREVEDWVRRRENTVGRDDDAG